MSTLELALLCLSVEFVLLAFGLTVLLLWRGHRQAAQVSDGAQRLVATVTREVPDRRAALHSLFSERYRMGPEAAAATVDEFIARERAFYDALLAIYLHRDPAAFAAIGTELGKLIEPWIALVPQGTVDAGQVEQLQADLKALADANAELNGRLAQSGQVMESLLAEYRAAFKQRALPEQITDITPRVESGRDADVDATDLDALLQNLEGAPRAAPVERESSEA